MIKFIAIATLLFSTVVLASENTQNYRCIFSILKKQGELEVAFKTGILHLRPVESIGGGFGTLHTFSDGTELKVSGVATSCMSENSANPCNGFADFTFFLESEKKHFRKSVGEISISGTGVDHFQLKPYEVVVSCEVLKEWSQTE